MFDEIPMNCRYGYIRVSSKSQALESQKKLLINEGVPEKNIRVEVGSAANCFFHLIENELKENCNENR